jgi:iron complex outermembrane receptor protein
MRREMLATSSPRSIAAWFCAGWAVSAVCCMAEPACAQTQPAPTPPQPNAVAPPNSAQAPATQIQEIIVTARRVSESLQTTPSAVTAVTSAQLQQHSLDTISGLSQFTPSLQSNAGTGGGNFNTQFYIRGVGQADYLPTSDPGVGVYVDGAYIARTTGNTFDLADVSQVEVLRGPQGTLFGKNTNGGAILVTTTPPSQEPSGTAEATVGSRDRLDLRLSVQGPLVPDVLAGELTVVSRTQDGYGPSLAGGTDLGSTDMKAIRAALYYTPNDRTSYYLTADYTRDRDHMNPIELLAVYNSSIIATYTKYVLAPLGESYTSKYVTNEPHTTWADNGQNESNLDDAGVTGVGTWEASDALTLKSISAFRYQKVYQQLDDDGSPLSLINVDRGFTDYTVSQEFQASGSFFDKRLKYVGGLYYFYENSDIPIVAEQFAGLYTAMLAAGAANPIDDTYSSMIKQKTNSYAGYLNLDYALTDKLGVSAGVRYGADQKSVTETAFHLEKGTSLFRLENDPTENLPPNYQIGSNLFDPSVNYAFGIHYQLLPNVYTYATYSTGFKSGGYDSRPITNISAPSGFGPETVDTYEVGAKLDFLDRHARLNLAAYDSNYDNMQVSVNAQIPNFTVTVTRNAGDAVIRGVEAEGMILPLPGLQFDASGAYTDAYFTSLDKQVPFTLNDHLPETPTWQASVGGQYTWALSDYGSVTARMDYSYKSTVFLELPNTYTLNANGSATANGPLDFPTKQPGYGLLDARVTFTSLDHKWAVSVFGTNLTNVAYRTFGSSSGPTGLSIAYYGDEREVGATLTRHF